MEKTKTINDLYGFVDICNESVLGSVMAGCSNGPINTQPDREKQEAENYEQAKQYQPPFDNGYGGTNRGNK